VIGRKPKIPPSEHVFVRIRARKRETYLSIARSYGVSESSIARIVNRSRPTGRPPLRYQCACGSLEVRRFSLSYHPPRSKASKGAGSAHLCEDCWRKLTHRG
jgi:hypothetical protein